MNQLKEFEEKTTKLLEALKEELLSFRTDRPTAKIIENVKVEYAGSVLSLNQLGSINIDPPRDLIVTVWDRGAIPAIVKAIEAANLGLGVQPEASLVRVKFPPMTEERKQILQKNIKSAAEEKKIKMRLIRDEAKNSINQEGDEDLKFRGKEEIQKIVDQFNQKVDDLVEGKIGELKK
ncbi:MAG TPA: ribosome-recycling factor [Candidatus Tyrphobacter sp.]|nr:ribosome-recycling factor [Candidatus Tyrphobacter sp.]